MVSSFSTCKRSACDRCRRQKLRCPARGGKSETCGRCSRAGVVCVTGYTLPLGRLSRDQYSSIQTDNAPPLSTATIGPQASPTIPEPCRPLGPPGSVPFGTETKLAADVLTDPWFSGNVGDYDDLSSETYVWDSGDSTYQDLSTLHSERAMVCGDDSAIEYQKEQHSGTESSSSVASSSAEPEVRLSQLNLELSHIMHRRTLSSYGQDGQQAFLKTIQDSNNEMVTGEDDYATAFSKALRCTCEYLDILGMYGGHREAARQGTELHSADGTTGMGDPASFSFTLGTLSCYFRLVEALDDLLTQLHHGLRRRREGGGGRFQMLPELCIAGFCIVRGTSLQAKMVIQVIQHQFERIERRLGLPPEFRVSDRRETCPGQTGQCDYMRGILQSMVDGQQQEHQYQLQQKSRRGVSDASGGNRDRDDRSVGSLDSLRRNIIKLLHIAEA